jgi:hypothetical protein
MIRLLKSAIPFSPGPRPDEASEMEEAAVSTEAAIEEPTDDAEGHDTDQALEDGIASIFALIRSGNEADELPEGLTIEETGPTYELLSELDRLWNSA